MSINHSAAILIACSITPVRHDDIIGVIVNQKSFAIFS